MKCIRQGAIAHHLGEHLLCTQKAAGSRPAGSKRKYEMFDYIPMNLLLPYWLYKIRARNAEYGIWLPEYTGFAISRIKFGNNFVFVEYHWDCEAFATAAPLKIIEQSPFTSDDFVYKKEVANLPREEEILAYLNRFEGTAAGRFM